MKTTDKKQSIQDRGIYLGNVNQFDKIDKKLMEDKDIFIGGWCGSVYVEKHKRKDLIKKL